MNPQEIFSNYEFNQMKNIGLKLENRIYTPEECRLLETKVLEYIMNESTENIPKLLIIFKPILNTLVEFQKVK
ncbi:MAG: hypothetical protein HFJ38_05800 [Bacilli bacterium]|nr:hypothetical protein [Bacilli bacterium]